MGYASGTVPIQMPVAIPSPASPEHGSLWVPGSKQFFKDSRAHTVGDIITVVVAENASANSSGSTSEARTHSQKSGINGLLNFGSGITDHGLKLGDATFMDTSSERAFSGSGKTGRNDTLTASIAAVVTQVMPNGLLVIQGQREVLVNYEKQMMTLQGVIRPEDITSGNTIASSKIAEARIAYSGKGIVDDNQTPQYGARFLNKIMPF
jgi:flagellar L-ring protein precursor FlgH